MKKFITVLSVGGCLVEITVGAMSEELAQMAIKRAAALWVTFPFIAVEEVEDGV